MSGARPARRRKSKPSLPEDQRSPPSPLAAFDAGLRARHGHRLIGGLDEAGRGALAGPVVAAIVVFGPGVHLPAVNDSKALKAAQREALAPLIVEQAHSFALGMASADEIDSLNVLQATLLAAGRALAALSAAPDFLVTDYLKLKNAPSPVLPIAKGDATSLAVAAASVLAKVARDRIMLLLDNEFPDYGFARHKGYGTSAHLAALQRVGGSAVHRRTFAGVCWFGDEISIPAASTGDPEASVQSGQPDWRALLLADGGPVSASPFLPSRGTTTSLQRQL